MGADSSIVPLSAADCLETEWSIGLPESLFVAEAVLLFTIRSLM